MSGPSRDEQLYNEWSDEQDWDKAKVSDLRSLADRVEDGFYGSGSDDVPNDQIANLLRAKADKIEAALRTIDNETHDDYNDLVKAIQYKFSGDCGIDKVQEAWENYGEK